MRDNIAALVNSLIGPALFVLYLRVSVLLAREGGSALYERIDFR